MNASDSDKANWPWSITPQRLFFCFIMLHLVAWTIIPALYSPNAPLDVIEGYAWGREWLIGTYKHPPMQSWWLEIMAILTGRANYAHFLASQIAIAIAFWAVWQTGRRLTTEPRALLGVLLLEGVAYYNFTTPEFNPNVLQLPFWALMAWSFHRGVKDNRLLDWLLLGVWAAGGMYSKYTAAILIGLLGLLLPLQPEARQRLKSPGPWLAVVVFTLLFAPHIYWLATHGWQPFTYAESRTDHAAQWQDYFLQPAKFLLGQIGVILAAILLLLGLSGGKKETTPATQRSGFDRTFLFTIAWGPLITVLLLSLLGGVKLRDMWGSSLWNFPALWVLVALQPALKNWRHFVYGWGFVFLLGLTLHTAFDVLGPAVTHKDKRVHFPGATMAAQISEKWQTLYHHPLEYAIGDTWLAGNLAYYTPSSGAKTRPHVFLAADKAISPWIDNDDLRHKGGVIVWCSNHCKDRAAAENMPAAFASIFPYAALQQPLTLAWQTDAALPPVLIGWAIIPPEDVNAP